MHFLYSGSPVSASEVSVTTAEVQVTAERRLSNERLPGEPGPSTDDRRPWPADATTSAARVPQRHHRHYRSDSCRPPPPTTEQRHRHNRTTSTAVTPDMITVAASGSRAAARPKPRTHWPSSSIPFPVDVADRLRSPMASPSRPRQYGRRRSVQDAVASAVMLQRHHEGLQLQTPVTAAGDTTAEPDAGQMQASGADREQGQEPRLVASIRLVCTIEILIYY